MDKVITKVDLDYFEHELVEEEKCISSIKKYRKDIERFQKEMGGSIVTKEHVIRYKQKLVEQYAVSTVNGVIASLNKFFKIMGWYDCVVKSLKVQRAAFRSQGRELTKNEYYRLLETAKKRNNIQLYYLMQTICATGIRISELKFITVESVKKGGAQISLKGKNRIILLPASLCKMLRVYMNQCDIHSGSIFVTKTGKPLDRSNIFRAMKNLCEDAHVDSDKVFPHNLRHLFACIYYKEEKDIARLADILGHSSIETTRIYLATSQKEHNRQLERMNLVLRV